MGRLFGGSVGCSTLKMDPTPSFWVSMISEVPSNPQLTLGLEPTSSHYRKIEIHVKMRIGKYESFFLSRISRVHYGIIDWFTIFDDFGFENLEFQNAFQLIFEFLTFISFMHFTSLKYIFIRITQSCLLSH